MTLVQYISIYAYTNILPVDTPAQPAHFKTCTQKPHNLRQIFNQKRSYLCTKIEIFQIFYLFPHKHLQILAIPKIHEFSIKCASRSNSGGPERSRGIYPN